jgi:cytochrome b6-f complex iron-sulfur subunit
MERKINRGAFLKDLGLSSGALMAFYCLGGVSACKSETEPAPTSPAGTTTPVNTKIDFTLDLSSNDFKKLKTEGEFVYKDSIIIANVKGGKYVALSKACTHQNTSVQYRLNSDDFWCPTHGSEFASSGKVNKSPAASPLTVYSTELKADILRIFE